MERSGQARGCELTKNILSERRGGKGKGSSRKMLLKESKARGEVKDEAGRRPRARYYVRRGAWQKYMKRSKDASTTRVRSCELRRKKY